MTDDPFGFPARRQTAEKIRAIAPGGDAPGHEAGSLGRADDAGAALGFVPRDASRPALLRRRKEVGPTTAINMRVPDAVAARFIAFCDDNRLSYWEGVDELMRRSGLP